MMRLSMLKELFTWGRRKCCGWLLALLTLLSAFPLAAKDFTYKGVDYTVIDEETKTCKTKDAYESLLPLNFSGDIELPETAYDGDTSYRLVEIGAGTFWNCKDLTSVAIPASVSTIRYCAFYGCAGLKSVKIPDSVTIIEGNAFGDCSSLESVTLPDNLREIAYSMFMGCTSLASISIPDSVEEIENDAFSGCVGLKSVTIPATVTEIQYRVFKGCTSLREVTIEGTPKIGKYVFQDCMLKPLVLKGEYDEPLDDDIFYGMDYQSYIICSDSVRKLINNYKNLLYIFYTFENPYVADSIEPMICGVKIGVRQNPCFEGVANPENVFVNVDEGHLENPVASVTVSDLMKNPLIKGLKAGNHTYVARIIEEKDGNNDVALNKVFRTAEVYIDFKKETNTTSIKISSISAPADETASPVIYVKDNDRYVEYKGGNIVLKNLRPGTSYNTLVYADYNGERIDAGTLWTQELKVTATSNEVGPTSLRLYGSYEIGDAVYVDSFWQQYGRYLNPNSSYVTDWYEVSKEADTVLTGLTPDTEVQVAYNVSWKTEDGKISGTDYNKFIASVIKPTPTKGLKIKLPALELEIQQPKCVSNTNAIVAARTNMKDDEVNAGFQWKKYDAPASLKPNESLAPVSDGMMEGYIRNLQTTSYYNVRAFYKDKEGKYYYSEWMTFDPSDFSYFEPTVRTYPVGNVGETTARLRGYALAGTDDIVSQGFQYWLSAGPGVRRAAASDDKVHTVEASGQVMTVSLTDLMPGNEYTYRAFVETKAGYKYGDEEVFTTSDASGIHDIDSEPTTVYPVAYYDLSGNRHATPCKGLNIIVYSDGTAGKVYIR